MAKPVVPPSKPPADKGNHVIVNFPVANVKEQSVKVMLEDPDESATASSIKVSFETFSPTKRYEKIVAMPEPVSLRQLSKNVTSKMCSIVLLKAAFAPPPSPASQATSPKATSVPSPLIVPKAEEPEVPPLESEDRKRTMSSDLPSQSEEEAGKQKPEKCENAPLPSEKNADGGTASSKKKKNNKPKKKGKALKVADDEDAEDEDVIAARDDVEHAKAELDVARGALTAPRKELEEAQKKGDQAAAKVKHLEAELKKWQEHYQAEIKKWQAEQKKAGIRIEEGTARLAQAQTAVESCEEKMEEKRQMVRDAEAKARQRELDAAEKERQQKEKEEQEAQEEKKRYQEERRIRAEEERQKAHEEKKRKEAERKENARKREEERKQQEAEEERRRLEKKGKTASSSSSTASANSMGQRFINLSSSQQSQIATLVKLYKKDPQQAKSSMKDSSRGSGGAALLLALAQGLEDSKELGSSGEAYLEALAHPDVESLLGEKERNDMAMKAMSLLKDSPDKQLECLPLFEKLTPKYGILAMGSLLASQLRQSSSVKQPAAGKISPTKDQPWRGPLIEEIETTPTAARNDKSASKSTDSRSSATNGAGAATAALKAATDAGWVLDRESADGPSWVLELPVDSIESLQEVNLDISSTAIVLTPIAGGKAVAQSMVPNDADADQAAAKWSKKKRILTIRMPKVSA